MSLKPNRISVNFLSVVSGWATNQTEPLFLRLSLYKEHH